MAVTLVLIAVTSACGATGRESVLTPSATIATAAASTEPTESATPSSEPSAVATSAERPSPTRVPARESLLAAKHPFVKLGTALDAIEVALASTKGMSEGRGGVVNGRSRCQVIPGVDTVPPHFVADDCFGVATSAYLSYLDTGDIAWFDAALAMWNYAWNFDFGRGCCYVQADTRGQAVEQFRKVVADRFPEFVDQVL